MLVAGAELGGIRSNIPLSPELALGADLRADAHLVIDFGDDELTRGRAHPMIDPTLRLERIAAEAADPGCGVLLLDLVLGHGAHPDPAPELADAIRGARAVAAAAGRELPVVVSLTGTRGDPQGLDASGAAAVRLPARSCTCPTPRPPGTPWPSSPRDPEGANPMSTPLHGLLETDPVVATAGASMFADALRDQAVEVTETDWQPPLDGTAPHLRRVLGDPRRAEANQLALERMTSAGADFVDVRPASEALGLERGDVPARRSADRVGARVGSAPGRPHRRDAVRGDGRHGRGRRGRAGPRRRRARAVPPPRRGRPDGGRDLPVDVGLRAARRGARPHVVVLPQRRSRQGAALRRLRPRGHRPAALDELGAGTVAAAGDSRCRPDRREVDHRPDAADGRRGPQPQPGRVADAAARAAAHPDHRRRDVERHRRGGALLRRERALLPQPRHAGVQAVDAGGGGHRRVDRRDDDGPQRHRLRHPDRGHRRPVVHRAGQHPRGVVPRLLRARTTPTPTSATRPSPRRPASGGSRWRPPPPS